MPPASSPRRGLLATLILLIVLALMAVAGMVFASRQAASVVQQTPSPLVRERPASLPEGVETVIKDVPPIRPTDIVFGDPKAPVLIYEYSDLECPFCKLFQFTLDQVRKEYGGQVAVVYRHYPLSKHENARMEAEILSCAARQDMDVARTLIQLTFTRSQSTGTSFTRDTYLALAREAGAVEEKLARCYDQGDTRTLVERDIQEGRELGVTGTPTTFILAPSQKRPPVMLVGSKPYDVVTQVVNFVAP